MSPLHPVAGPPPEGWTAGFIRGCLHAQEIHDSTSAGEYRIDCPGLVGPPCWIGQTIEYTCIDEAEVSQLCCWTPGQGVQTTSLPQGAIAAYSMADGDLGVAIASPASGHLTSLLTLAPDGAVRHCLNIPMAWRVGVAPSAASILWTLSRRGRRFRVTQSAHGFTQERDAWPTAGWKRLWLDAPHPHGRIPAWVRAGVRASRTWIALHGGPGLAWDHGLPAWLMAVSDEADAILLLEMPGSAGFGGPLLRWGWQPAAAQEFIPVLSNASRWLEKRFPGARKILCGESDGAAYALAAASQRDVASDLLVLLNGDYPSPSAALQAPASARVLMVTSDLDEVVDNESAFRLIQHFRLLGLQVEHCRIAEGHRWQSVQPAGLVAARINTLLQSLESSPLHARSADGLPYES